MILNMMMNALDIHKNQLHKKTSNTSWILFSKSELKRDKRHREDIVRQSKSLNSSNL